jgi:hypothetical protein
MNASSIDRILLRIWWRTVSLVSVAIAMRDGRRSVAYQRGLELLKANLTASQLNDFLTYRCFDVVGGGSGSTYRIRLAGALNVEELDQRGRSTRRLCFLPRRSARGWGRYARSKSCARDVRIRGIGRCEQIPGRFGNQSFVKLLAWEVTVNGVPIPCLRAGLPAS